MKLNEESSGMCENHKNTIGKKKGEIVVGVAHPFETLPKQLMCTHAHTDTHTRTRTSMGHDVFIALRQTWS